MESRGKSGHATIADAQDEGKLPFHSIVLERKTSRGRYSSIAWIESKISGGRKDPKATENFHGKSEGEGRPS